MLEVTGSLFIPAVNDAGDLRCMLDGSVEPMKACAGEAMIARQAAKAAARAMETENISSWTLEGKRDTAGMGWGYLGVSLLYI